MSRTKDLKTTSENNLNLFNLFSMFSVEGKTKYTETLLRIMKSTPKLDEQSKVVRSRLIDDFNLKTEDLDEFTPLHLLMFHRILDSMFNFSDLKIFQKFCDYNERGLIKQNDVSKYRDFDQITSAVSLAEIIADTKDLEKQVQIVYDLNDWLLVRPLTFESSKKYGSNTKWCTTTENNPEYFIKFATKGVLIYCINKSTGYKVASFYSLDKREPEFSFWNQKDVRVDSMDTELTDELRSIIFRESKGNNVKSNRSLLSEEEKIKEQKLLSKFNINYKNYEPIINHDEEQRVVYLNRRSEITELSEQDEEELRRSTNLFSYNNINFGTSYLSHLFLPDNITNEPLDNVD